jgi:hypothetical protein
MCVIGTTPLETLWYAIHAQSESSQDPETMDYDPASPHFDPALPVLSLCTAVGGARRLGCAALESATCCCRDYDGTSTPDLATCSCPYDPASPVWEEPTPVEAVEEAPRYIATSPIYCPGVYCLVPGPLPCLGCEASVDDLDDMDEEDTL